MKFARLLQDFRKQVAYDGNLLNPVSLTTIANSAVTGIQPTFHSLIFVAPLYAMHPNAMRTIITCSNISLRM